MIIKWLDDAIDDLQALRQYIAKDKPSAANRVAKQVLKAVNLLSGQPSMGRAGRVLGTRELVVSSTPYIIPYRVKNNSIEILRVLHVAMEWPEEINPSELITEYIIRQTNNKNIFALGLSVDIKRYQHILPQFNIDLLKTKFNLIGNHWDFKY